MITDANGAFVAPLSPDVHEVNVWTAAPGFAYTLDHVPVRDQLLTVAINQQGGTLTLQAPAGKRLTLSRGIVTVPPSLLIVQWIATSSLEAGGRMMIRSPMMDPGPYSLCDESGRCDSGTLDPFGSLTLALP